MSRAKNGTVGDSKGSWRRRRRRRRRKKSGTVAYVKLTKRVRWCCATRASHWLEKESMTGCVMGWWNGRGQRMQSSNEKRKSWSGSGRQKTGNHASRKSRRQSRR